MDSKFDLINGIKSLQIAINLKKINLNIKFSILSYKKVSKFPLRLKNRPLTHLLEASILFLSKLDIDENMKLLNFALMGSSTQILWSDAFNFNLENDTVFPKT